MSRFRGKTVVITGASSGIGESCARKFVNEGARVVLAARSKDALDKLSAELGPEVTQSVPTDIANVGECKHLLQEAVSRFGSIDVLVCAVDLQFAELLFHVDEIAGGCVEAVGQ